MKKKNNRKKIITIVLIVIGIVLLEAVIFIIAFNRSSAEQESVPAANIISQATTAPTQNTEASKPKEDSTKESAKEKQTESKAETKPETKAETPTATPTSPTTTPTTTTESEKSPIPENMANALQSAGYSISDISAQQLIIVQSQGNSAVINMYSRDNSGRWSDMSLTSYGYVGSNGVDIKSMEGDYKTPYGLFSIGDMFYIDSMPQTGLNSFQITSDTYWVDDPASAYYNQRVEGTANMDWTSAEHMISYYTSYKYGFVINYNMNPVIPGKGSAIFFHIGYEPTAGCVAVSESDMLAYLGALDKDKNPCILII